MSNKATLRFRTNFHSTELTGLELPVEVRAANRRLVTRTLTSKSVEVNAGKYFVSSRLPAGQELHAYVEVSAGDTVEVILEPDDCDESPSESQEVQHFLRKSTYRPPRNAASDLSISYLRGNTGGLESFSIPENSITALSTWHSSALESFVAPHQPVEVQLPDVVELRWYAGNLLEKNCQLISSMEIRTDTKPQPVELPPEVCTQRAPVVCQILQAHTSPSNVLIPMSENSQPPALTLLPPEPGFSGFRIGVRLPHNTADLLTRYLRRGMFLEAGETIASDSMTAEQLIYNKRTDPIAACVGAYAILRLGDLTRLHEWTQNLRTLFPWLPDGAAIRGEHLARNGEHYEALTVFLELKARGLPLFNEGLSYALERLRLYTGKKTAPSGSTPDEIARARDLLSRLESFGVYADFDRTYVTWPGEDPVSPSTGSPGTGPSDNCSSLISPGVSQMSTELNGSKDEFVFNGINGATGEYLEAPKTAHQVVMMALADPTFQVNLKGQDPAARHLKELKARNLIKDSESFGPRFGVAPDKLEEAGWAVVFPRGVDPHIVDALRPLLNRRREQAGSLYKEFQGDKAYMKGDSKDDFLRRQGMGPGQPDPPRVPYYVLIVGDPETIPYSFQYQLDVQYAVGRIWFETVEEYARYAESVVHAESGRISLPRKVALFGAENPGDRATELSANQLVAPLAARAKARGIAGQWQVDSILSGDATRSRLTEVLGGDKTPALLFTATHGMGFPRGDSRQIVHQGALLCQDWPGPAARRVDREHYFAAEDVSDSARLAGLICFHFACYGAGTPLLDDFAHQSSRAPTAIAPRPFVAALPRRLLGHPLGGALAVIGHVERAWDCSIVWPKIGPQIQAFEDTIDALMQGLPVGHALEAINQRYADLSSALSLDLLAIRDTVKEVDDFVLASQWTANNDARSYVLIGDPAVRLPVAAAGGPVIDRTTTTISIRPATAEPAAAIPDRPADLRVDEPHVVTQSESCATTNDFSASVSQSPAPQAAGAMSVIINVPLKLTISVALDAAAAVQVLPVTAAVAPIGTAAAPSGTESFAIQIDPDYDNRQGYDPDFLGTGTKRVPLPKLTASQLADAAAVNGATGADRHELKYHHYSVVLNGKRRLAFFTAVNINGKQATSPKREKDKWIFDPRVPQSMQAGEDLYAGNKLDRGHLVRRLDPAWGRTAAIIKRANDDTFHFTNCSPQHERFNQGKNLWAGLEDYLLNKAADEDRLMTVFTGSVFTTSDPLYRPVDIRVPKRYWKVAVVVRPNGKLASLGFIVDQTELLRDTISFRPADVARTFQVPVSKIEALTGLSFGRLTDLDAGSVSSFAIGEPAERELNSFDDIALPTATQTTATRAFDVPASSLPLPPETVEGTDLRYYLVAYDEAGKERRDHPAGQISRLVEQAVADPATTDVLLVSHGWQGDVPGARDQYTRWIRAMATSTADRTRIRQVRPGFRPVVVGVHWPSQPWGDENLAAATFALDATTGGTAGQPTLAAALEDWTDRLGDNPDARERIRTPLRTILESIEQITAEPAQLPLELREAYLQLDSALSLGAQGVGGNPGSDREPFDPAGVYEASRNLPASAAPGVSFSGGFFSRDTLLAPLRALSFWKMKDRARVIGEGAVHDLLVRLQQAAGNQSVRFHLAGHSFGCIVVTGAITGAPGSVPLPRPIDSLSLLQGALSLWSFCSDVPHARGTAGYFHKLIAENRVRGPIVTTRSSFDSAVGTWYPLAARVSRSVAFDAPDTLPKYGGIGSFGIQGDLNISDLEILAADRPYTFVPGCIANVNASKVINKGGGWSGAHSDIAKPEVAHLIWSVIVG